MFLGRIIKPLQPILIAVFLTGCFHTKTVNIEGSIPRPPDQAMVECQTDLPNAKGPTRKDVLEARAATARIVIECAERQKTLKEYIEEIVTKN